MFSAVVQPIIYCWLCLCTQSLLVSKVSPTHTNGSWCTFLEGASWPKNQSLILCWQSGKRNPFCPIFNRHSDFQWYSNSLEFFARWQHYNARGIKWRFKWLPSAAYKSVKIIFSYNSVVDCDRTWSNYQAVTDRTALGVTTCRHCLWIYATAAAYNTVQNKGCAWKPQITANQPQITANHHKSA